MSEKKRKPVTKKPSVDVLDQKIKDVSSFMKLLSDSTRYKIMHLLATCETGRLNVTEICEHIQQSQPAVSHHIAMLRYSSIIESQREGKNNYYNICNRKIGSLSVIDLVKNCVEN